MPEVPAKDRGAHIRRQFLMIEGEICRRSTYQPARVGQDGRIALLRSGRLFGWVTPAEILALLQG